MAKEQKSRRRDPPRVYDKRSGEYRPVPVYGDFGGAACAAVSPAKRRADTRKKRRRRALLIFYIVLFLIVIAAAVVISLTVLFKIDDIQVVGTSCYTAQQVTQAGGIEKGENLFLAKTSQAEKQISKKLPYVGTVKVSRKFPAEIVIRVSAAAACGAIENNGKYAVISNEGKVLEVTDKLPQNCANIKGAQVLNATAGEKIVFKEAAQETNIKNVIQTLSANKIQKITAMDFSKSNKIQVVYENRITINLGLPSDLDYKIRFAENILTNKIKSTEKGTLDMSVASENDRAYFDPDYESSSASSG